MKTYTSHGKVILWLGLEVEIKKNKNFFFHKYDKLHQKANILLVFYYFTP